MSVDRSRRLRLRIQTDGSVVVVKVAHWRNRRNVSRIVQLKKTKFGGGSNEF